MADADWKWARLFQGPMVGGFRGDTVVADTVFAPRSTWEPFDELVEAPKLGTQIDRLAGLIDRMEAAELRRDYARLTAEWRARKL